MVSLNKRSVFAVCAIAALLVISCRVCSRMQRQTPRRQRPLPDVGTHVPRDLRRSERQKVQLGRVQDCSVRVLLHGPALPSRRPASCISGTFQFASISRCRAEPAADSRSGSEPACVIESTDSAPEAHLSRRRWTAARKGSSCSASGGKSCYYPGQLCDNYAVDIDHVPVRVPTATAARPGRRWSSRSSATRVHLQSSKPA